MPASSIYVLYFILCQVRVDERSHLCFWRSLHCKFIRQHKKWTDGRLTLPPYKVMTTMHTVLWNKDVHFSLVAYLLQAGWWNRKGPTVSLAAWYWSCSWLSCGFTVHCSDCFVYILKKYLQIRRCTTGKSKRATAATQTQIS